MSAGGAGFQDTDESGYIEYRCRRTGIPVHYCAEQFENDGSPTSNIIKSVKRSMAGEYSRELSTKVFAGACRLIQLGFKQGGKAGFGLRRMVVDPAGRPKGVLQPGEQKFLATDRVVLVPGPEAEQQIVREVYHAFVHEGKSVRQLVAELTIRGLTDEGGQPWTRRRLHRVLTHEHYLGNLVYYKTSYRLKQQHLRIPPERWVRADGAFPGIVAPALFQQAQEILRDRTIPYTKPELLDRLRADRARWGRLSAALIDGTPGGPASATYARHFGTLAQAYALIGSRPERNNSFHLENRRLAAQRRQVMADLTAGCAALGVAVEHDPVTGVMRLAREFTLTVVMARCRRLKRQIWRWQFRADRLARADLAIVVRMDRANQVIQDYYLLPRLDRPRRDREVAAWNDCLLDSYFSPNSMCASGSFVGLGSYCLG